MKGATFNAPFDTPQLLYVPIVSFKDSEVQTTFFLHLFNFKHLRAHVWDTVSLKSKAYLFQAKLFWAWSH